MMELNHTDTHTHAFPLKEIASWTPGVCQDVKMNFRASIPALQRGLVWKPQQNELLWDSILRGFPIGAIVVTEWSDKLVKRHEAEDRSIKYHLLDGQQRCHAIAIGFSDPFTAEVTDRKEVKSILWLDLNPKREPNSTRNFWVRATTTAHPWGYRRNDVATPLVARDIRQALNMVGLDAAGPNYKRPWPIDLWPCKAAAEIPVPLSWLLQLPLDDEVIFWSLLGKKAAEAKNFQWAKGVHDFCEFCTTSEAADNKNRIFKGIKRALSAQLIALEVSDELLEVAEQEKSNDNNLDREGVSNIEQLFQRLNQQGTRLDGEELAYSMIKAYWPDLERPINEASKGRMPEARMVSLGVRAALANDGKDNLPGPPSVSSLRATARSENVSDKEKKQVIQDFITQDLHISCKCVGYWLEYDPCNNPSGLLPVHITSIAMYSREVYLLLLHFAKRMGGKDVPEGWNKTMQALATLIHWFAPEKAKVANMVYAHCRHGEPSLRNIGTALKEAIGAGALHTLHTPEAVRAFVKLPSEAELKSWAWSKLIYRQEDQEGNESRRKLWDGFLWFRGNKELLLYAQREFLAKRFQGYDPARKDLWEDCNRPWDFDHILAANYFYNRKDGSAFRGLCGEWGYTIGNLRAWPFEDNRADHAEIARDKLSRDGKLDDLEHSFIETEQVEGFSGGDKARSDGARAKLFAEACRDRLLKIYQTWYESVGVAKLLPVEDANSLAMQE